MSIKNLIAIGIVVTAGLSCPAQNTVTTTTTGTANQVPKFTGSSTVGNSVISEVNGNVGIGTTSPDAPLKVNASGGATKIFGPNLELNNFSTEYNLSVASGNFNIQNNSDGGAPIRFTIQGGTGNVGIGTTPLGANLEVSGTSGTTQTNIARFDNSTNGAYTSMSSAGTTSVIGTWTNGSQITEFVPYGSGNGIIDAYTGNLIFQTGRNNQMTITPAGNVGLGMNPLYKLDVAGQANATGYCISGNCINAWPTANPWGVSGSNTYYTSGNVGIGTTNPAYRLDVNGGIDAATVNSTAMFTGHQLGGSYAYSDAIFKAVTDNPNGSANYYFQGVTGSTTNFNVRADGQGYFAGGINSGNLGFISSYRSPSNNYTNLFMGGALADNGNGGYTVQTDGGSNYFAAIRMDNSGGNAGAINFYTAGSSGGSSYTISNSQLPSYQRMTIVGSNVGIGTSSPGAKLEVNGNIRLTSGSGASMTYPDGTVQSTAWNGTTCGGDYAESVDVTGDRKRYEAGDVLVIDADSPDKFLHSSEPYSRFVAGIYSTRPGLTGRREGRVKTGEEVPMAMLGIVPTKVSAENGAIRPGDLLVSSAMEGYAMKGTDATRMMGAVIGKAMGRLDKGTGTIEVLVSLQ